MWRKAFGSRYVRLGKQGSGSALSRSERARARERELGVMDQSREDRATLLPAAAYGLRCLSGT
eukprot:scaffold301_cov243-Pinguiococcus_pyrenoidosus.AAC.177